MGEKYNLSLEGSQINDALMKVHNNTLIEKSSIDKTLSVANTAADAAVVGEKIEENYTYIAAQYDATKSYKAKDICFYNDDLYVCVTDIYPSEAWNPEHWALISLSNELKSAYQTEKLLSHLIGLKGLKPEELQEIAQSGRAREFLNVGDVIYIPWIDRAVDPAIEYSVPNIVVDFMDAEDSQGNIHPNAPILMWMYTPPHSITYDISENDFTLTEGDTIQSNFYYYGYDGTNYYMLDPQPEVGSVVPVGATYYKHDFSGAGSVLRYGLCDWQWSAVRQWLNSSVEKNVGWWKSQHPCDCTVTSLYNNYPGFMNGFSDEWRIIFKPTKVQTLRNRLFNFEVSTTYDTFFLPSIRQVYGVGTTAQNNVEGPWWEYWKEILHYSSPSNGSTSNIDPARKIGSLEAKNAGRNISLRSSRLSQSADIHRPFRFNSVGYIDATYAYGSLYTLPVTVIY